MKRKKAKAPDFSKPLSFRDEPIEKVKQRAEKLSDLKNIGPESEKALTKAGICSVEIFFRWGWQKVFSKLVESNPKNRHAVFAYALIGAEKNTHWANISEADKSEARSLSQKLKSKREK
jgi:hypothetical protein